MSKMINAANFFGAFLRWMIRGFHTNFKDELICTEGWFKRIPFLELFENVILAQLFAIIVLVVILLLI